MPPPSDHQEFEIDSPEYIKNFIYDCATEGIDQDRGAQEQAYLDCDHNDINAEVREDVNELKLILNGPVLTEFYSHTLATTYKI